MKAFTPKGWKRAVITTDNRKLKPWRQQLSGTAEEAMKRGKCQMIERPGAARMSVTFFFARPKSLKKSIVEKTTKPDLDKLVRAFKDSLKGIVYEDDSQVVECLSRKGFGLPERTEAVVQSVESGEEWKLGLS